MGVFLNKLITAYPFSIVDLACDNVRTSMTELGQLCKQGDSIASNDIF